MNSGNRIAFTNDVDLTQVYLLFFFEKIIFTFLLASVYRSLSNSRLITPSVIFLFITGKIFYSVKHSNAQEYEATTFNSLDSIDQSFQNTDRDTTCEIPNFSINSVKEDARPSHYECAVLSSHVYEGNNLKEDDEVSGLMDWVVKVVQPGSSQFFGVIYENIRTRHLVVSYRGTNTFSALIEDIRGIFFNGVLTPQKNEAFKLTQKAIQLAEKYRSPVSFVGHSLGAYLAELSLYYCHAFYQPKNSNNFDVRDQAHAVTFESPGTLNIIDKMKRNICSSRILLKDLDITTYLSYPNLINTCNEQSGTVYSLKPKISDWSDVPGWHLSQVHSIDNIISLFDSHPIKQPNRTFMLDWPIGNQRSKYFDWVKLIDGEYKWIKPLQDVFQADYKFTASGHYLWDKELDSWNILPARHLGRPLRNWLERFYKSLLNFSNEDGFFSRLKKKYSSLSVPDNIISLLISSTLVRESSHNIVYLVINSNNPEHTSAYFRREISRWLSENKKKSEELLLAPFKESRNTDIEAAALAPGSVLEATGRLENIDIVAVSVDIPEDTNKEMIKYFNKVSEDFLNTLKRTGTTIGAYIAAPGAVVKGPIVNAKVRALSFRVGSEVMSSINRLGGMESVGHKRSVLSESFFMSKNTENGNNVGKVEEVSSVNP